MKAIDPKRIKHLEARASQKELYEQRLQDIAEEVMPRLCLQNADTPNKEIAKTFYDQLTEYGQDTILTAPQAIAVLTKNPNLASQANSTSTWSREFRGTDTHGVLGKKSAEVTVITHGRDIVSKNEYDAFGDVRGLAANRLYHQELQNLLREKDIETPFYTIEDVMHERVANPYGTYAVWHPTKANLGSQGFTKKEFMKSPYMLARAGTREHLEAFFDNFNEDNTMVVTKPTDILYLRHEPIIYLTSIKGTTVSSHELFNCEGFLVRKRKVQQ